MDEHFKSMIKKYIETEMFYIERYDGENTIDLEYLQSLKDEDISKIATKCLGDYKIINASCLADAICDAIHDCIYSYRKEV